MKLPELRDQLKDKTQPVDPPLPWICVWVGVDNQRIADQIHSSIVKLADARGRMKLTAVYRLGEHQRYDVMSDVHGQLESMGWDWEEFDTLVPGTEGPQLVEIIWDIWKKPPLPLVERE